MRISIYESEKKDCSNMSFVGMHNTKEGIIAFADSKATIQYNNGFETEDTKRGKINKVFKNDKFICVTHGNNELFSSKNKINIEEYFHKELPKNENYEAFFINLYTKLFIDTPEYNDGIYNFIIGSKDCNNRYYIICLKFDVNVTDLKKGIESLKNQFSHRDYSFKTYYAGNKSFVDIYDIYPKYNDLNIASYSSQIKESLTLLIKSFNTVNRAYCSVGLPVIVKIFK